MDSILDDPVFQISSQFIEAIQSYWFASAGYRNWVLMAVRANDLKWSLMFWIQYLVTIEFPFTYPLLYNPSFSTLWASFAPFSFGESERSPVVRAYLSFWEERGFMFDFSSFCIPFDFFEWENVFEYENSNFSSTFTCFLK